MNPDTPREHASCLEFEREVYQNISRMLTIMGVAAEQPCRSCNQPIRFVKTKEGRAMPVDRDMKSHFVTCPDADKFRSKR